MDKLQEDQTSFFASVFTVEDPNLPVMENVPELLENKLPRRCNISKNKEVET